MEENNNQVENTKETKPIEENKVAEPKKQNNKVLIIIIVVLLFIIVGLLAVFIPPMLKATKNNEKTTEEKDKKHKDKDETKETELTDQAIIDNLNLKIRYLTNESKEGVTYGYSFRNGEISDFGDFFHNLDDDLKLYVVLDYLYKENKFHALAPENESDPLIATYVKNMGASEVKQITGQEVKQEYKNFFGTDQVDLTVLKERMCFNYKYASNKDLFYKEAPTCGGSSASRIYVYKNKYSIKGDNAYVYVNYGMIKPKEGSSNGMTIIKGLEDEEEYKTVSSYEEARTFEINAENYKEFSEYKYIFQKDETGNYYFVSFEKTK